MLDLSVILMPILYIVIVLFILKPIIEMFKDFTGKTKIKMPKKATDNIKIKELSDVVYSFMKEDCILHSSHIAKKLYLRTGLDIKVYIGKIKGWNKDKEMTYFYIKRKFKRFILITNKEIDTLHYEVIIKADTIKHFTDNIIYLTEYEKEKEDFLNIYKYLTKYYLSVMNVQAIDGQYYNMISVYRKNLAEIIDKSIYKNKKENEDNDNENI